MKFTYLTGGASAIAAAARKNLRAAEAVSSTGDMLSGRVLNAVGLHAHQVPHEHLGVGSRTVANTIRNYVTRPRFARLGTPHGPPMGAIKGELIWV